MTGTSDTRRRAKDESFPRFFAKFLLVYALFVASCIAWWLNADDLHHWWSQAPFDSGTWQAAKGSDHTDSRRQAMVDDLITRGVLVGRSKAEVLGLLGEADQVDLDAQRDMLYALGSRRHSLEWLAIDLGEDGKVQGVGIYRD